METPWRSKLGESVVLVLAVAVAARAVWELMAPLVPALAVLVVATGLASWLARRH